MDSNTDCTYHNAAPARLELADALESGKYRQMPREDRLNCLLRDTDNRYSITGVATAELTQSVWVKYDDMWRVHPFEAFHHAFPKMKNVPNEFTQPHENFIHRLEEHSGNGTNQGCPEETACALGIHEDREGSTHPELLWFNASAITPEQKATARIPRDWTLHYLLDTLDFNLAATLLRQYPDILEGCCTCEARES